MLDDSNNARNNGGPHRKLSILILLAAVLTVLLIVGTKEISRRNLSTFISSEEKYILGFEAAALSILIVEMLVGLATQRLHGHQMTQLGTNLRLTVRIAGYLIASVCVVSILSSNPTLGISVGAFAGVVVAFATQSTVGSMLATIVLISSRMLRVGEEISISGTKGTVVQIGLLHTIVAIEDDIAYVPNSLMIASVMRRKRRTLDHATDPREL
jgi:small-conductance mechanosensitive channel